MYPLTEFNAILIIILNVINQFWIVVPILYLVKNNDTPFVSIYTGVKVSLECRRPDNGSLTYSSEGHTDKNGIYSVAVKGDHDDEICQLKTVKSTHSDCNEVMANWADRIVLTKNMGVSSMARYVNPLGFKTQGINPECAKVIKELGLDNLDDWVREKLI